MSLFGFGCPRVLCCIFRFFPLWRITASAKVWSLDRGYFVWKSLQTQKQKYTFSPKKINKRCVNFHIICILRIVDNRWSSFCFRWNKIWSLSSSPSESLLSISEMPARFRPLHRYQNLPLVVFCSMSKKSIKICVKWVTILSSELSDIRQKLLQ